MIEAIPTWNGNDESVELYEQYHVGYLNPEEITKEIKIKWKRFMLVLKLKSQILS